MITKLDLITKYSYNNNINILFFYGIYINAIRSLDQNIFTNEYNKFLGIEFSLKINKKIEIHVILRKRTE